MTSLEVNEQLENLMADDKPTLVLIHGLFDDPAMWEPQVRHLSRYARVVVPEILEQETVEQAARDVLAGVDGPMAVVGFSMGGYVLLEMLRQAPERISRICLLDTSARADLPEEVEERHRVIGVAGGGKYEAFVRDIVPSALHASRANDAALIETLVDMALRIGPEAFCRQQRIIMNRPDSRADLAGITCPALIICGREDVVTPLELSEEMAAGIPDARLVVIEECNHYASMERPWAVSALLQQWLHYP
jgi:pimeloyl-ACP methyl ester carboxylesterase